MLNFLLLSNFRRYICHKISNHSWIWSWECCQNSLSSFSVFYTSGIDDCPRHVHIKWNWEKVLVFTNGNQSIVNCSFHWRIKIWHNAKTYFDYLLAFLTFIATAWQKYLPLLLKWSPMKLHLLPTFFLLSLLQY